MVVRPPARPLVLPITAESNGHPGAYIRWHYVGADGWLQYGSVYVPTAGASFHCDILTRCERRHWSAVFSARFSWARQDYGAARKRRVMNAAAVAIPASAAVKRFVWTHVR